MALSLKVENMILQRAFGEIAKAAGVAYQDVVRAETKSILESALKRTRAAQVASITANVQSRPVRSFEGKKYRMFWRMRDEVWKGIQNQIKASIARRKAARGLSKKSWLQLAQDLGISIDAPGYVAASTSSKGDYPENATGKENKSAQAFSIKITNSRTYDRTIFDAIRAAMAGRAEFFKKNLQEGVFEKIGSIAAKYPGLNLK
jgi:hypothetical protein